MKANTEERKKLQSRFAKNQLNAGIIGLLEGTLIGIVSGAYLKYKYDHGLNTKFFRTPYKVLWIVSWNVIGIITQINTSRAQFLRQVAIEEDLKRNIYYQEELNGQRK